MNDKELANAVVGLGVGESTLADAGEILYRFDDDDGWSWQFDDTADEFVRDWRVAGALLTLVYDAYANIDDVTQTFEGDPRSIIEACVEALT